jgi:hypothetical protein
MKAYPIPDELAANDAEAAGFLRSVEAARPLADRLIVSGLFAFGHPSMLADAIQSILDEDSADYKALIKKIERRERVLAKATLSDEQQMALNDMADAVSEAATHGGEAGYILGLAVGQRIQLPKPSGGVR